VTAPNWDLLDQDEYWDTEREGRVRLVDMTPTHRANLVDRLVALVAEDRANGAPK
jgi:hypothetical protein